MSKQSQILGALRVGLVALCAMAVYEITKQICFARLSLVESHIITVFFVGCVGFCITFIIRQREKDAQQEMLRLATIVQQSEDGIISAELDGTITSWNRGAERIYGYSAVEALGRHISFCYPPEKHAKAHTFLQRIADGETIERIETQRVTKNGTIIDVSLSVSAIKDGTGKIVGGSGISRDVTARRQAQDALVESERRYRSLFENMLEGFAYCEMLFDDGGRPIDFVYLAVNSTFGKLTGLENVVGKRVTEVIPGIKESEPELFERYGRVALTGKPERFEIEVKALGIWFSISAYAAENGRFVATFDNVTERKRAELRLRVAEEQYRTIFEENSIGICNSTADGRFLSVNPAFARMFGYDSPEEMLARVLNARQLYVDAKHRREIGRQLREQGKCEDREFQGYRKDGSTIWIRASVRAVHNADGSFLYYVGAAENITEHKCLEERVQFLAYYDALTGLPNRTLLQDRLTKALASARRRKDKVALLFLDLDGFKTVNDSLGHSVGDIVLKEVAERLKKWAREQDTVARVGGDEFLVVLTAIKDISDAAVAAERLMDAITAEFVVQGHFLGISCSIGISIFAEHGRDGETLIKNADAAMYCAKESGRNNFRFFTKDMNAQAVERLTLENSLRLALGRGELFLVYQPQMEIATGRITGLEALLRWQHPELDLVPPDNFIRIAENSGLIMPIGEWVLRTACSQTRKWQDEGLPAVPVAVNVSAVQFRQAGFCELIGRVLWETGLAPQYLELELTESLLLSNADVMFSVLQELKAMGLKLAIDDFGTGYSSLSYLKQFPVGRLKIDRSFIRDIAVNPDDAAITTAIISMAKSLSLKVIAEGVEDEAQMSFLRAHQCDEIQGYYFSKPLAVDKVADKLRGDYPEHVRAQARGL
jgi:diguanylate cyclase (GGDEF)-like protein/PAS domain S-box-containing protein